MNKTSIIVVFTAIMAVFTSCEKASDLIGKNQSVDPSEYFDFSTVYGCPIEIDLEDQALISIYDEDPELNPDAKPIYATYTGTDGQYKGVMQLPSAYEGKQLWARGFGYEATAYVGKNGVKFVADYAYSRAGSRADDGINHMFTDDELVIECNRLHKLYLSRLPENHNNTSKLTETENLAIHTLKDDTEIMFAFVNSGARYVSQLYYFYFPEEVDATEYMKEYVTRKAQAAGTTPDLSSLNLRTEFMRLFTNDAADPNKKFLLTRDWGVFYTGKNKYVTGRNAHSGGEDRYVLDPDGNVLEGNGFLDAQLSYTQAELDAAKAKNIIQSYHGTEYTWDKGWDYKGYGYINRNFNNQVGAHHHLRFYGPNYDQYLDQPNYKFPAGYRVGFILKVKNTDTGEFHCFTTNNQLNLNGAVQCARNLSVSPSYAERNLTNIVYGYEDNLIERIDKNNASEPDYNDFMFLVAASPAVSTVGLERMVDEGELYIDGTLLYEDLYPSAGDYDMNDVMVEYEMWVKFDKNNYVTSIESRFWPINYGATYNNDFYMELTTDDNKGTVKTYIEPELVLSSHDLSYMSQLNMQDIMAGKRPQRSVMHRHEFTADDRLHRDSVTIENFNPFILVKNTNREVHLTNGRFCGVDGATNAGLTPGEMKYYPLMINDGSMLDGCYFPYAMNVPRRFSRPSMEGFTPVTESVYIVLEYQQFLDWMRNPRAPEYKAWYNYYQKWGGK